MVTFAPAAAVLGVIETRSGGVAGWELVPIAKMWRVPWVAPVGRVTPTSVLPARTGTAAEKRYVLTVCWTGLQYEQLR